MRSCHDDKIHGFMYGGDGMYRQERSYNEEEGSQREIFEVMASSLVMVAVLDLSPLRNLVLRVCHPPA